MIDNYHCKLFVNSDLTKKELAQKIEAYTNGIIAGNYIECDWASLDVRYNEEYSIKMIEESGPDSFLYYKYYVDIDKDSRVVDDQYYIGMMKDLIQSIKSDSSAVVASCDFEDQLS